jgi:hypothetical protein
MITIGHVETVWLGWRKHRAEAHAVAEACMTWLGVNGFLPPNVKTIVRPDTSYPDGGYHVWLSVSKAIYSKLHDVLAEQMPQGR